jgi:hypothetical protein
VIETLADATYSDDGHDGHDGQAMDVCCPKCERGLWAEKVYVANTFSVWVFFDNEERSDTYALPVGHCPECGAWLTEGGGWPTRGMPEGHLKRNVDL